MSAQNNQDYLAIGAEMLVEYLCWHLKLEPLFVFRNKVLLGYMFLSLQEGSASFLVHTKLYA